MLKHLKAPDAFFKNVVLVFAGTTIVNFFNLLYQLLIAHKLSAADFASFNSLLAVFMLASSPLTTVQTAIAKYTADIKATQDHSKLNSFFYTLFRKAVIAAILSVVILYPVIFPALNKLKIGPAVCGNIFVFLFAVSCVLPVFMGGLQGTERFGWLMSASFVAGLSKLLLAFIFLYLGFSVTGAWAALFISFALMLVFSMYGLKRFVKFAAGPATVNFKEMFIYFFPIGISTFCFVLLTNSDMVLVKYYFTPQDSGIYSIAQMVGKMFLFFPAAVSVVLFPKTSGLAAQKMKTLHVLNKSLVYTAFLCLLAGLAYNIAPGFILKLLTGKPIPESITLGRMFGVSMTFFVLTYIMIMYFLSVKDLRFVKYLVFFSIIQVAGIASFHQSLINVQMVLCMNSIAVFFIGIILAYTKK